MNTCFVIKQIKDLKKKLLLKQLKNWLISRYNPKFKICHKLQFKCFKKLWMIINNYFFLNVPSILSKI